MTADQHYAEAERFLGLADKADFGPEADYYLMKAQVHATLTHAIWQKAMADAVAEPFA